MMLRGVKAGLAAAVTAAVIGLTGCAHPQLVELGDTETAVLERLGEPMAKTKMADGTERWTYSLQPYGQEVWWLFVDETGHVVSREQGLQEKYFSLVKPGVSTEEDVWKLWGRCAQKYTFHLVNQHAWMYRYKDFGGFDMAVWPQFDEKGVVQSVETTTDPWKEKDGEWLFTF